MHTITTTTNIIGKMGIIVSKFIDCEVKKENETFDYWKNKK